MSTMCVEHEKSMHGAWEAVSVQCVDSAWCVLVVYGKHPLCVLVDSSSPSSLMDVCGVPLFGAHIAAVNPGLPTVLLLPSSISFGHVLMSRSL